MPRGKRAKKNKCNENALTTRLIQISMKMDDHIYSNKLITSTQAASYLQEVATLKLRSLPTNTRALQVIEKLTRLMSNLLTEDTGHTNSSNNQFLQMTNQFERSASPVYSLPDEDRNVNIAEPNVVKDFDTFLIRYDDDVTHKDVDISNREIITTNASQIQDDSTYCGTVMEDIIEVIDITNDNDIEGIENVVVVNKPNITIEHVNTGISNMSLQEDFGSQTQFHNDTCSQSILDNFDNNITKETVKERNRTKEAEMFMYSKMVSKTSNTNNVKDHCKVPSEAMATQATISPPKVVVNRPIIANEDIPVDKSKLLKKTYYAEKKVTNKKDNKLKRGRTKKNKEGKVDNAPHVRLQNGPHTTTSSKHCSNNNDKENYPKTVKKPKNGKKVKDIYNENIENDLSWVENLRFVREISPSEHDTTLTILQDNFWDNFQLPCTWDDLDFNI